MQSNISSRIHRNTNLLTYGWIEKFEKMRSKENIFARRLRWKTRFVHFHKMFSPKVSFWKLNLEMEDKHSTGFEMLSKLSERTNSFLLLHDSLFVAQSRRRSSRTTKKYFRDRTRNTNACESSKTFLVTNYTKKLFFDFLRFVNKILS